MEKFFCCIWTAQCYEQQETKIVDLSFFCDDNGYTDIDASAVDELSPESGIFLGVGMYVYRLPDIYGIGAEK